MQYTVKRRRIIYAPMSWSMKKQVKAIPLSTAVEGFLLACRARQLSRNTLIDYERTLKLFIKHVSATPRSKASRRPRLMPSLLPSLIRRKPS